MSDPFAVQGSVRLKPGRDASLRRRHPWVYRGALAEPLPRAAAPLVVEAANGRRAGVAMAGASGGSLALRMLAFGDEPWDRDTLRRRLEDAARLRRRMQLGADAFRLVHAEGDGLPGLVVDIYADIAVIETFEPAWGPYLDELVLVLRAHGAATVLRRGGGRDGSVAAVAGDLPEEPVTVREDPVRLVADLVGGQKTGLFLDQRENRRRVGALAADAEVLNLFAYSGGFAVAALAGGARRVVSVDASAAALDLARLTYRANGYRADDGDLVEGDAFTVTRRMVDEGRRFDIVVVDPPAFARRRADVERALRGYKDINIQALRLVRSGGLVLSCSCSARVDETAFGQMLFAAALDAGVELAVLERRGAGADHPVSVYCPETRHLKAWLCAVSRG